MNKTIDVILVAAGSGTRLGASVPKAFVPLGEKPICAYALEVLHSHPAVRRIVLVVPGTMQHIAEREFASDRVRVVQGGEQRWQSVNNGMCNTDTEWVMVHDAARPFVTHAVIDAVVEKRDAYQCVITVTPETDTIRTFDGDRAGVTVNREHLVRVGTPQLFKRQVLIQNLQKASLMENPPTDEAMLMQQAGIAVGIAWGDPKNFKITTQSDLSIAEAIVARDSEMLLGRR